MSWEREPLFAKSKLFFERALEQERDSAFFGLWCALGIELLGRAALASIHPTLLAEPDREHRHLLHALNRGSERVPRKSITSVQVFTLCKSLFEVFTKDDFKASMALINVRNEELHTGASAFEQYKATNWLANFYRACNSLCNAMSVPLEELLGEDEAKIAEGIIAENRTQIEQKVKSEIAAHKRVFEGKIKQERDKLKLEAEEEGKKLAFQRHHRVKCPACNCTATIQGTEFGRENVTTVDDEIIIRQAVSPSTFECKACELKLNSYSELEVAGLAGHYMRTTTYTPEDYFGLIHPDNIDEYVDDHIGRYPEFDNE